MKSKYRQAKWDEPLLFEQDQPGKVGHLVIEAAESIKSELGSLDSLIPKMLLRKSELSLPRLSEVEVVNHYTRLSQMNYGVDLGIYPLGSCTMKYNPRINETIASLPGAANLHPYQDEMTVQGMLSILYEFQEWLAEITGMEAVSIQPAAGAHGEYAGIMTIRAFHKEKGELDTRTEIIVPDSAHGTNPATAKMAGFKVVVVPSNDRGCVDTKALEAVVSEKTACIMLTNPNTLGLFEEEIDKIAEMVHGHGAKLYYDGANLNANLGRLRPGDIGFDVVHVNLHKTFSTPHGGGGPGSGCIGVCSDMKPFLPVPVVGKRSNGSYFLDYDRPKSIGKVKGFYGNIGIVLRAYTYIMALGAEGLKESSESAVLASNYLIAKLKGTKGLDLPYSPNKPRKHEVVFSAEPIKKDIGITAGDIAHRILDYGMHAPTNYFPQVVQEALMIEPTESFDKGVLDNYAVAVKEILADAYKDPEFIKKSPHRTAVCSVDEAKASRMSDLALTWRMYQKRLNEKK